MKKLDKLLAKGYVGPFVVTFFIAVFVLMMQKLWLYIDDIVGKGAGLFFIIEMIFYMSIALMPMALPIAVLISSVMLIGNHAERYELSSMKSAGIPLLRVMAPLMVITAGISLFSFVCSNNLMPVSNLKFRARLYDLKKSKPTLNLEEGIFNEDFSNFTIHIGEKEGDNRTIRDVLIYDREKNLKGKVSQIVAKEGEMYVTEDEQYFVMYLQDGTQYEEMEPDKEKKPGKVKDNYYNLPFVRTSFKEWTKVFDLSEFDMSKTDADLFKNHHFFMSVGQLRIQVDTIREGIENRKDRLRGYTNRYLKHFSCC